MRNIPRNYQNEADVKQAIKEKQKKYETTSMSSVDEKKLLKDIDALKKALPDMEKLAQIQPELVQIRDEWKTIKQRLEKINAIIDDKVEKVEDARAQTQAQRDKQSEVRDEAEKYTAEIDKAGEDLKQCYVTKDQMRESFFKQLYEFELQNDKVRWIKSFVNQQKRAKQVQEEKEERIKRKRAELENRENPFAKEIATCDHLVSYCNSLKKNLGLVPESSEQVAKKTETELINEYNRQDIEQKLKDGKILAVVNKKDDDAVVIGGGKGKKGKKQKTQTAAADKAFNIDFNAISKFGLVSVSPPTAADEIDAKIEELNKKKTHFEQEGQKLLDQEKEAIEKDIVKLVEEDIEAERKAAEQEEYGEEEEKEERDDERRHSHRGRGGFAKTYGGREQVA